MRDYPASSVWALNACINVPRRGPKKDLLFGGEEALEMLDSGEREIFRRNRKQTPLEPPGSTLFFDFS